MSRKAIIGIKQTDGSVRSIYCISDGDLGKCGATLYKYYITPERVNKLIDLGIVNKVGKYLIRKDLGEFTLPYKEDDVQINNYDNEEDFKKDYFFKWAPSYDSAIECYLFDEESKKWLVASSFSEKFLPFEKIAFGEDFNKQDAINYVIKLKQAIENPDCYDINNEDAEHFQTIINIRANRIKKLIANLKDGDKVKTNSSSKIEAYRNIKEMLTSQEPNIELFDNKQYQKKRYY